MKNRLLYICSIILIISFIILTKYEDRQFMRELDFAMTVKLQEYIDTSSHMRLSAVVGMILEGVGLFAGPVITGLFVLGITGYFVLSGKNNIRYFALLIPLLFAVIVGVELVSKLLVHHPPPPFFMIKNSVASFPAYHVTEIFSYPSGHASRAVFVALFAYGACCLRKERIVLHKLLTASVLGVYVFLVSVSKVYLGHHWSSDILGGILLGSGLGLLTWVVLSPYNTKHNE